MHAGIQDRIMKHYFFPMEQLHSGPVAKLYIRNWHHACFIGCLTHQLFIIMLRHLHNLCFRNRCLKAYQNKTNSLLMIWIKIRLFFFTRVSKYHRQNRNYGPHTAFLDYHHQHGTHMIYGSKAKPTVNRVGGRDMITTKALTCMSLIMGFVVNVNLAHVDTLNDTHERYEHLSEWNG